MEQNGNRTDVGGSPKADAGLIDIFIPIRPVAQARARGAFIGGRISMYTPRSSRAFKEQLAAQIWIAVGSRICLDEALHVDIEVTLDRPKSARKRRHPTVKPDLDNFEKAIMDACTDAGLWRDDSVVVSKFSVKRYGDRPEDVGVRIAVRPKSADR
jgi:Holliday junction resolvase RusA-like endonuclease